MSGAIDRDALDVSDPLAEQTVAVTVTVLPAPDQPRGARPVMVAVGVAGAEPVLQTGVLADVDGLLSAAWRAYGARARLRQAAALDPLAAAAVLDEGAATAPEGAPPDSPTPPTAPQPTQHLSLFD